MSQPHVPSPRTERVTAAIALALVAVLAAYHVWDARAALSDFEGWWAYFQPQFPGDDYAKVTEYSERQDDWHDRYRAIALGMATRRTAPDADTLYRPAGLWSLWGENASAPRSWEAPGIKEDYFLSASTYLKHVERDYDPRLPDETIAAWRAQGLVTDIAWNVAYVSTGGTDPEPEVLVLHTDGGRAIVYVVPLPLSPLEGGS